MKSEKISANHLYDKELNVENMYGMHKKVKVKVTHSCLTLCNPMDCICQASLSMEFSRQEYWSGLPFLSPGDLPHPGIKSGSLTLQADSLPSEPLGKPWAFVYKWKWNLITRKQIYFKNDQRNWIDIFLKMYKWPTCSRRDLQCH